MRVVTLPRVLVLDDEPPVVRVLARVLRSVAQVEVATTIEGAVEAARTAAFDVFVTDYDLGPADGFDAARRVGEVCNKSPAIIMYSGTDDLRVPERAAAIGVVFVHKSEEPKVLREAVARAARGCD